MGYKNVGKITRNEWTSKVFFVVVDILYNSVGR